MSATELFWSRTGDSDLSKSRRERYFYVDVPRDAALFDPTLPQIGTVYPGGTVNTVFPLVLDSYKVDHAPNGNAIVTCVYTNDRSGRLAPNADKTHPAFKGWTVTYVDTNADYPTITTYPLKVPGVPDSGGARGAETTVHKIAETHIVYERRVTLTALTTTQLKAIGRQNGRLHKIDGKVWQFKASTIEQTERDAFEIAYSYRLDPGTYDPAQPITLGGPVQGPSGQPFYYIGPAVDARKLFIPPDIQFLSTNIFAPELVNDAFGYRRIPFHITSFALDKNMEPIWFNWCPPKYDPLGWQELPSIGF